LESILFIIFINDLSDVALSILLLFADDAKLYQPLTTTARDMDNLLGGSSSLNIGNAMLCQ